MTCLTRARPTKRALHISLTTQYIFTRSGTCQAIKQIDSYAIMSLEIEITTPNGHSYKQPTGLFIGNEFIASTGRTIVSLDPAYGMHFCIIK